MGREHHRQGKYFFLYIACIIILFTISGCAAFKEINQNREADKSIMLGQRFIENHDFVSALSENEKALSIVESGPVHNRALFNIGLIYAHINNPDRDLIQARRYFSDLLDKSPEHALGIQAALWIDIIDNLEEAEEKIRKTGIEIENIRTEGAEAAEISSFLAKSRKLLKMHKFNEALSVSNNILNLPNKAGMGDLALFNIGLIYAHYENPDKDYRVSLEFFRKLIRQYPESQLTEEAKIWIDILDIIEKAKLVDIDIEKKKKELTK